MNIKRSLILILVLFSLTACGWASQSGRSHGSRSAIQNETNTDVYTFDLPQEARELSLDLDFQAEQGSFAWVVTGPDGEAAWQGQVDTPSSISDSRSLPLTPGRWTLEVQMEAAGGGYEIEWRSR